MQHYPGRHAHVEAGRPPSVLRYANEAVARGHLLRRHPGSLVAHHESDRRGKRLLFHIFRRGVYLHPDDGNGRSSGRLGLDRVFPGRRPVVRDALDALDAIRQPVEPRDFHRAAPQRASDRRRDVRALRVRIEFEIPLAHDEHRGAPVRGGDLKEVLHVLALGDVRYDEVRGGPRARMLVAARWRRRRRWIGLHLCRR